MDIRPVILWKFKNNKHDKETAEKISYAHGQGVITDRQVEVPVVKLLSY